MENDVNLEGMELYKERCVRLLELITSHFNNDNKNDELATLSYKKWLNLIDRVAEEIKE